MADLARQAMEKIAEIVGDRFEDADVEVLRAGINSVGTLVSHEDAALLREVKRMIAHATDVELTKTRDGWWFASITVQTQTHWNRAERPTPTAAIQSALDAAHVPDAKGS